MNGELNNIANVHNIMEEMVKEEVEKLFDAAERQKAPWLSCSCPQCKCDTLCYVLNRIPPKYIRSGRGISHHITGLISEKPQIQADITTLTIEGMKRVLETQRPHPVADNAKNDAPQDGQKPPVFNFPTITGRVLNGLSFEPEKNIEVGLYLDGELCQAINASWENPYKINENTPGNFAFWVKPLSAHTTDENKVFGFEIRIHAEGKEPLSHFFEVGLTSENIIRNAYNANNSMALPDFYLFPIEDEYASMK